MVLKFDNTKKNLARDRSEQQRKSRPFYMEKETAKETNNSRVVHGL